MDEQKREIAKEAMKAITELEESTRLENVIKDNKAPFSVGNRNFRVRKPSVQEQAEIDSERRKKYSKLIDDDSYHFRKQWIAKYLKRGINIVKMENDIIRLQDNVKSLLLRLATETTTDNIKKIKKEILKIRNQQTDINTEKVDLMEHCIEDQVVLHTNSYTSYVVLERLEGTKWVKHFESFEDYQNCKDWKLLNHMYYWISVLIYETEM